MTRVTEAEACRWLGRPVSLIGPDGERVSAGLLRHVSSRSAFVLERAGATPDSLPVRLISLSAVARIEPAQGTTFKTRPS